MFSFTAKMFFLKSEQMKVSSYTIVWYKNVWTTIFWVQKNLDWKEAIYRPHECPVNSHQFTSYMNEIVPLDALSYQIELYLCQLAFLSILLYDQVWMLLGK